MTATYSDIQGGWSGTGNLDADPLFVDADGADDVAGTADDNLRLQPGSPAIDAGNNAAVPAGVTTDLDGAPRIFNSVVDMGAYEHRPWYVDDDGAAGNGCTSWADACPDLQTALGQAGRGDEIWVAAGTYKPDASGDRTATFQLKSGVAVYGGFAGTETLRSQRDWATHVTTLSGDIGTAGAATDNSYHVVTGSGTDATAVLDGFTITGGNADGSAPHNSGGGMYNSGGSPTLTNVTFSGNSAHLRRRDVQRQRQQPDADQRHLQRQLGAIRRRRIYNDSASSPTLTNVTFSGNSATSYGGGIYNSSGSPSLANSILWGNSAGSDGAQIYRRSAASATYSDIQGGWSGTGNLDADPLFVDADGADNVPGTADDNLRLQARLTGHRRGQQWGRAGGVTTDSDGAPRILNGMVDMGAFERHPWYVNDDGAAGNGCVSWTDACPDLQTAPGPGHSGDEIWVTAGTYSAHAYPASARLPSNSRAAWQSTAALPGPKRCEVSGIGPRI